MSCCEVELHVAQIDGVSLSVGKSDVTALTVGSEIYNIDTPPYEGEYLVTPSESPQTLVTSGKRLDQDVVVEAIPSNYGRIAYNGSVITVW